MPKSKSSSNSGASTSSNFRVTVHGSGFSIILLAMNVMILYYVYKLEADHCKCVRDWRHNYIKYFIRCQVILS